MLVIPSVNTGFAGLNTNMDFLCKNTIFQVAVCT